MVENKSGFIPLDTWLVVKPKKAPEKSRDGIIWTKPQIERLEKQQTMCQIIAMGDNAFFEWGDVAKRPRVGDWVTIKKFSALTCPGKDGREYWKVEDENVVDILDSEPWDTFDMIFRPEYKL